MKSFASGDIARILLHRGQPMLRPKTVGTSGVRKITLLAGTPSAEVEVKSRDGAITEKILKAIAEGKLNRTEIQQLINAEAKIGEPDPMSEARGLRESHPRSELQEREVSLRFRLPA
jgi:hypothetical protein